MYKNIEDCIKKYSKVLDEKCICYNFSNLYETNNFEKYKLVQDCKQIKKNTNLKSSLI